MLPLPSSAQIISSAPYSQTPSAYVPPSVSATKFHTHTERKGVTGKEKQFQEALQESNDESSTEDNR